MWHLREVSAVIALFVVLVCEQAPAAGEQRIVDTDGPVAVTVVRKKQVSTSPIGRCSTTKASFNVRIHSVKSKTTSFSRVLMSMPPIETYASKLGNGTAKDIGICAEMADKGGFKGFSFTGGLCKMFSLGRQPCRCNAGSGDLIYVRDSFWDKQDLVIPAVVPVLQELVEYVHFPSTVVSQNLDILISSVSMVSKSDVDVMNEYMLPNLPGYTVFMCNGPDKCYTTYNVDFKHCSMGCNSSSSWTARRLFTYKQKIFDDIAPPIYILSECGKTITLDGTFPEGDDYSGTTSRFVLSHEGYGCKWYPKQAEAHECAVTFRFLSSFDIVIGAIGLDHDSNSVSCDGDSVLIYLVQPEGNVLKTELNGCVARDQAYGESNPGEVIIVFKRHAKQYLSSGFNLGFMLTVHSHK